MMTEAELFEKMKRELYTGLVCDVMDSLGYRNQAMHCRIQIGRASCRERV